MGKTNSWYKGWPSLSGTSNHILSLIAYTSRENRYFVFITIVQFMMSANIRIRFGLQIVFVCLYITPYHYHHCANLSEDVELIKCLSDIFYGVCKIKHIISVIHNKICADVCFWTFGGILVKIQILSTKKIPFNCHLQIIVHFVGALVSQWHRTRDNQWFKCAIAWHGFNDTWQSTSRRKWPQKLSYKSNQWSLVLLRGGARHNAVLDNRQEGTHQPPYFLLDGCFQYA